MPEVLTQIQMRALLREYVAEVGTQVDAAKQLKITPAYLNDLLHGKRNISEAMAKKLGFTLVFTKE